MRHGPRRGRRMFGVGLLLPALLLTHSPALAADSAARKPPPKKVVPKSPRPAPSRSDAKAAARADDKPCVHVVKSGDTVGRVAGKYGVRAQALIDANRLARPQALRLGQRLTIPGCGQIEPQTLVVGVDGSITARVGPRRIPTKLFMGLPELNGRAIDLVWPVDGPVVSQFGRRRNGWHAGADIKADVGTPILAAAAGTVVYSGWGKSYGRLIRIEHENGMITVYAHNLQNFVEVGDRVEAGQVIGMVGRSGRATAYHLHFEVRMDGMAFNPVHLLPPPGPNVARAEEMEPPHDDDDDE